MHINKTSWKLVVYVTRLSKITINLEIMYFNTLLGTGRPTNLYLRNMNFWDTICSLMDFIWEEPTHRTTFLINVTINLKNVEPGNSSEYLWNIQKILYEQKNKNKNKKRYWKTRNIVHGGSTIIDQIKYLDT